MEAYSYENIYKRFTSKEGKGNLIVLDGSFLLLTLPSNILFKGIRLIDIIINNSDIDFTRAIERNEFENSFNTYVLHELINEYFINSDNEMLYNKLLEIISTYGEKYNLSSLDISITNDNLDKYSIFEYIIRFKMSMDNGIERYTNGLDKINVLDEVKDIENKWLYINNEVYITNVSDSILIYLRTFTKDYENSRGN